MTPHITVQNGLPYTPNPGWYLDADRPVHETFISHISSNVNGEHGLTHCSVQTADVLRMTSRRKEGYTPYRTGVSYGLKNCSITLLPAGHIFGSSQLLIEISGKRILYAGDIRLNGSPLSPPAATPQTDLLLLDGRTVNTSLSESAAEEAELTVAAQIGIARSSGRFPIFITQNTVGRAQDLIYLLGLQGLLGSLNWSIFQITTALSRAGLGLGPFCLWRDDAPFTADFLVLPQSIGLSRIQKLREKNGYVCLLKEIESPDNHGDSSVQWSERAHFDELTDYLDRVKAEEIWIYHDSNGLTDRLSKMGYNTRQL